jgi:glutathione synthase/RimK-type ligase-like ATP-grasp enzyme
MNETPRILILSSAEEAYGIDLNDTFVTALNDRLTQDGRVEWHNYHDIRLEFGTNRLEAFIQSTGEALSSFRFVYFKSFFRYNEQAAAVAAYLDSVHVPFVSSELRNTMPLTKLTQHVRLALDGVRIADTIYMSTEHYVDQFDYLTTKLGAPFIFKSTDGAGGRENYLISERSELEKAVAENPDLHFIAQQFIENDGDLRVLVIDRKVQLVIYRSRSGDTHLNNTSQGGSAQLLPLEELAPEHKAIALQAAALMHREIAGVDLMFEAKTGVPYILEVNASPQIGSGAFTDEKLAVYSNYFRNMLK